MNHEIICKHCGKDQRLYGLECCTKSEKEKVERIKLEEENIMKLGDILREKYGVIIYYGSYGSATIPKDQVAKLIKILGEG